MREIRRCEHGARVSDPMVAPLACVLCALSDLATLRSQLSEAREALDGLLKAFRSTTEYHRWGDDAEDFAFMERRGKFLGWEVFDPKGRVRGYIAAVRALSKLPSSKKQGGA